MLMVRIFITDSQSDWPKDRVEQVNKLYKDGTDFILREAKKYNVDDVSFAEEVIDYKAEFVIPTAMGDAKWRGNAMMAAVGASMPKDADKSPEGIVNYLKKKHNAKNIGVFFHVNKGAKSYTKCNYRGTHTRGFAECGILYHRYSEGKGQVTLAATYAHEILHLFGASELYFPYDKTKDRKNLAKQMFHSEIMSSVQKDIMSQCISEYTAYRIGWVDTLKKEHEVFEDPG